MEKFLRAKTNLIQFCLPMMMNLPSILRIATKCGGFDPLDKVYGSYGLFPPQPRRSLIEGIGMDYSKSVLDVYRDCVLYVVQNSGRLDFLKDCIGTKRIPGRPSWIPHWNEAIWDPLLYREFSMFSRTDAIWTGLPHDQLRLSAVIGPNIVERFTTEFNHPFSDDTLLARAFEKISSTLTAMGDKDPCRTIIMGFSHHDKHRYASNPPEFSISIDKAKDCVVALLETHGEAPKREEWGNFIHETTEACAMNSLFFTENALFGIGPRSSLDADILASLPGCEISIVSRRQEDGSYTVIGECYIYGLSYAGGLLGPSDPSLDFWRTSVTGNDGQTWYFTECARLKYNSKIFPDARLDWDKLKTKDENAKLKFKTWDGFGNERIVCAYRPDVEYFKSGDIPLQVIELA